MEKDNVLLIEIVALGQIQAVKELIQKLGLELDLNEKDSCGNVAIIIAAERNDFQMLKLLLENGANLNVKDGRGRTVKGWILHNKNIEMLEFIEKFKLSR